MTFRTVSPDLIAWKRAGLDALLLPDAARVEALRALSAEAGPKPRQGGASPDEGQARPSAASFRRPAPSAPRAAGNAGPFVPHGVEDAGPSSPSAPSARRAPGDAAPLASHAPRVSGNAGPFGPPDVGDAAPSARRAPGDAASSASFAPRASGDAAASAPSGGPSSAASRPSPGRVSAPSRSALSGETNAAGTAWTDLELPGPALPLESWPASWLALRNRRPLPPRPTVLWTYRGLGDDLLGTPDPQRRQIVVRMLMALKHPGGTHVFWPFSLPGDPPEAGVSLFWSGVALLRPRILLLFGSDARDALSLPDTLLPYCQERVGSLFAIQLPRPASLASSPEDFRSALAFLSRLLNFCSR